MNGRYGLDNDEYSLLKNMFRRLNIDIKKYIQRNYIKIIDGNLKVLDLSYEQLKFFPREILNFSNLEKLFLEGNEIKDLPRDILKLPLLTIDVEYNKLNTFSNKLLDNLREKGVNVNYE